MQFFMDFLILQIFMGFMILPIFMGFMQGYESSNWEMIQVTSRGGPPLS